MARTKQTARRSKQTAPDDGINTSSTVLKIGKATAAIAANENKPAVSVKVDVAEAGDKNRNDSLSSAPNRSGLRSFRHPTIRAHEKDDDVKIVTSNEAEDGANLHNGRAVPTKRTAPAPIEQNKKRIKENLHHVRDENPVESERTATYIRLVKDRRAIAKWRDALREKQRNLDAEVAMLERDADKVDMHLEALIVNASEEEVREWLMNGVN